MAGNDPHASNSPGCLGIDSFACLDLLPSRFALRSALTLSEGVPGQGSQALTQTHKYTQQLKPTPGQLPGSSWSTLQAPSQSASPSAAASPREGGEAEPAGQERENVLLLLCHLSQPHLLGSPRGCGSADATPPWAPLLSHTLHIPPAPGQALHSSR